MYELLDNYTLPITMITSVIFWWLSVQLVKKEDERYTLSKQEKLYTLIMTLAFGFAINIVNHNVTLITLFLMTGVVAVLTPSFVIDLKMQELPDRATILALMLAIPFVWIVNGKTLLFTLGFTAIVALALFVICYFSGGIGFGDVKLIVPILFFVPQVYMINFWLNAFICASLVAVGLFIKTKDKNLKFAFGPYLIIGLTSVFLHIIII